MQFNSISTLFEYYFTINLINFIVVFRHTLAFICTFMPVCNMSRLRKLYFRDTLMAFGCEYSQTQPTCAQYSF